MCCRALGYGVFPKVFAVKAGSVAGAETLKTRCVVCHAFVFARDAKTLVLNCKNVKRVPRARLFQVLCLSLLVFLARVFVHV